MADIDKWGIEERMGYVESTLGMTIGCMIHLVDDINDIREVIRMFSENDGFWQMLHKARNPGHVDNIREAIQNIAEKLAESPHLRVIENSDDPEPNI